MGTMAGQIWSVDQCKGIQDTSSWLKIPKTKEHSKALL
jgi:hypothetical protein